YNVTSSISLSANLTSIAEVKRLSYTTNPNITILGSNDQYFGIKGLEMEYGRGFSQLEVEFGTHVAVLGYKVYETLFPDGGNPVGMEITFLGSRFKIIGVLKEKGQLAEDNYDTMVIIPIIKANQMSQGRGLWYRLTVAVSDPARFEYAMGEATGVMRRIRGDRIGRENSFELERSETLAEELD